MNFIFIETLKSVPRGQDTCGDWGKENGSDQANYIAGLRKGAQNAGQPRGARANGDSFVGFSRSACSHTPRSQSADSENAAAAFRSEAGRP